MVSGVCGGVLFEFFWRSFGVLSGEPGFALGQGEFFGEFFSNLAGGVSGSSWGVLFTNLGDPCAVRGSGVIRGAPTRHLQLQTSSLTCDIAHVIEDVLCC